MKPSRILPAALFALSAAACGQAAAPPQTRPPADARPEQPMAPRAPDAAPPAPSDPGAVVVPPQTDPGAVATPPANVDPGITGSTDKVDKTNRKKSQDKPAPQ